MSKKLLVYVFVVIDDNSASLACLAFSRPYPVKAGESGSSQAKKQRSGQTRSPALFKKSILPVLILFLLPLILSLPSKRLRGEIKQGKPKKANRQDFQQCSPFSHNFKYIR